MQPRYRSFLPVISSVGLALVVGCGGGAGVSPGSSIRKGNTPPTAHFVGYSPNDPSLASYQPYTFSATATDPDIGDSITRYEWDFGDGSARIFTTVGSASHIFTSGGSPAVQVRAYDSSNEAGPFAQLTVNVIGAASPITAVFQAPAGPVTLQADPSGGVLTTFVVLVTSGSSGSIGLANLAFSPGDSLGSVLSSQASVGGIFTYVVRYGGASSAGTRTATPTVQVTDSQGITSALVSGPAITINTLALANHAPVIVITDPPTPTSAGFTSKPVNLGFTVTDADADVVSYTVDWGDGTPLTTAPTTGITSAGVAVSLTHVFPDSFTSTTRNTIILVNATDGRTNNGNAQQQTRTFSITYNTYPSASITSPQASATLPSSTELPSNPGIGLRNPPGPNDPDLLVIPSGGKVIFAGTAVAPGSGDPGLTYAWTFQGGIPATSNVLNPGAVIFNANPGSITPLLAQLTVTDIFNRNSSAAPGVNSKTFRKWIIVDGTNTQTFKLNFLYRQKADNNGNSAVSTAKSGADGLGANISIFQDGQTNNYAVQDQSGQAVVSIPVRSNLPFYVQIPAFGDDTRSYLLRIPNAPTGPYRDPSLGTALLPNTSSFGFENVGAPFNPTLKIVTGQGFAPEGQNPQQRHIVGTTPLVIGVTPPNTRWIDRLAIPVVGGDTLGALNQWVQSNNVIYGFDVVGNQSFAEWLMILKCQGTADLGELPTPDPTTTVANPGALGFNLNYTKYIGDTQASETFAASAMQAFRVPGGVTDPYDITLAGSNAASLTVDLKPQKVAAGVGPFFNNAVFASPGNSPLAGGIQNLLIPYDANDPDRKPYQNSIRTYAPTRSVFSYSEYLWSSVWARPLVLNQASLSWLDVNFALGAFPYFRRSKPTAWPMTTTGITPDNSQFNLTVSNGGTFDASSPVAIGTAPGTSGVGRFFWSAYTPFYSGANGSVISRTWQSDVNGQPPIAFTGSGTDATSAFGFVPPQDVVVDKRSRSANGTPVVPTATGGYRVTWFNPTKDASGNPVAPDFWVVELVTGAGAQHFMLPGSFPADPQKVTDLVLTNARTYLPSGNTAAQGPVVPDVTHPADLVGPGYCWFDIPVELRPTLGTATLTVFAAKAILKNNAPAGARPLNRPDWLDAIKTASATISINASSDLSYAHKVPFNFYWDVVITNSPRVFVAP